MWDALARLVGYNELARGAETLGERMYLRLARDEARRAYEGLGGRVEDAPADAPVAVVPTRPPFLVLSDADVELMRKAVAEHDARRAS